MKKEEEKEANLVKQKSGPKYMNYDRRAEFEMAAQLDDFAYALIEEHKARSELTTDGMMAIASLMRPLRPEVQYLLAECIADYLDDGRCRWSGLKVVDDQLRVIYALKTPSVPLKGGGLIVTTGGYRRNK